MGSSQSQPRRPRPSPRSSSTVPAEDFLASGPEHQSMSAGAGDSSPGPSARRRIFGDLSRNFRQDSSDGRDSPAGPKRERPGSTSSVNESIEKRRRTGELSSGISDAEGGVESPSLALPTASSSSSATPVDTPIAIDAPTPDPLLPERLQTLSTIQDTLGPDWTSSSSNSRTALERLRQLRRRSLPLDPTQSSSTSTSSAAATGGTSRLSDRLCTLFGLPPSSGQAVPVNPSLPPSQPLSPAQTPNLESSIEELTSQLERARSDLAETQRAAEQAQENLAAHARRLAEIDVEEAAASASVEAANNRIPAGAVLVIQGLAQTQALQDAATRENAAQNTADSAAGNPRRRSMSDMLGLRDSRPQAESSENSSTGTGEGGDGEHNGTSLEAQARMIGSLLTVAAAAAATTMLAPDSSPLAAGTRSTTSSTLSSFFDRFRSRRPSQTIETALGNYLRNALRDRNRNEDAGSISGPTSALPSAAPNSFTITEDAATPDAAAAISRDFQNFIEGLQTDLVEAVRLFASRPAGAASQAGAAETSETAAPAVVVDQSATSQVAAMDTSETAASANVEDPAHANEAIEPADSAETVPAIDIPVVTVEDTTTDDASPAAPAPDDAPIPAFHYQLGQVRQDGNAHRYGVSGGTDGDPRRLNFFRAHMFPPVRPNPAGSTPLPTGVDDPNGMVPCIFVGVRSIIHDPNMTTDDLVQHPNFPFSDGQVPPLSPAAEPASAPLFPVGSSASSLGNARPGTPLPAQPDRRSFRERVMERLTNTAAARRPQRPPGLLNTYLVFVIGGHYPRSHPILAIPNLVTGGPLTDEEMAMISEMLGPGKPPTATKEDIEQSGLMTVDASKIKELGENGTILENCVERCLVCLGDYEEGEECRVLKCRHAYHKECVDQWLSQGRNSCPACRTEAVKVQKKERAAGQQAEATESPAPPATAASPATGTSAPTIL